MKNRPLSQSLMLMLLGVAGAAFGVVVCFYGASLTTASRKFINTPEFIIWFFLNEALFASYPILLVWLWEPIKYLGRQARRNLPETLGFSVVLLALFIFLPVVGAKAIGLKPLPLAYADAKIALIEIVGFLVSALPSAVGVWLTQAAVRDAFSESKPADGDIKTYARLRDYLQQFLMVLGALLSLFILTGAALRAAALASGINKASEYPSIYLLLLGSYYTLLIAIIYFPAYLTLTSAGRSLVDLYFPLPRPDAKDWAAKCAGRKQLEDLLELKVTGEQRFLTSLTLLAPFVSSIFSILVDQ